MFYHVSPIQNKESILEKGLISKKGKVYLASTIYDAFLLAPAMGAYYKELDYIDKSIKFKFLYDWGFRRDEVSVFQVNLNSQVAINERALTPLSWLLNKLDLPPCQTDRIIYEYTVDNVPPENIKHIKDIALSIPEIVKTIPDRLSEYIKLIGKDKLSKAAAIDCLNSKYGATFRRFTLDELLALLDE